MNILGDLLEDPLKEGSLKASFGGEDLPEDPLQDSLEDPPRGSFKRSPKGEDPPADPFKGPPEDSIEHPLADP